MCYVEKIFSIILILILSSCVKTLEEKHGKIIQINNKNFVNKRIENNENLINENYKIEKTIVYNKYKIEIYRNIKYEILEEYTDEWFEVVYNNNLNEIYFVLIVKTHEEETIINGIYFNQKTNLLFNKNKVYFQRTNAIYELDLINLIERVIYIHDKETKTILLDIVDDKLFVKINKVEFDTRRIIESSNFHIKI